MNKLVSFLLGLLFFIVGQAYCQVNDAGLWLSGNIEKKLSQSFAISYSEEVRLMENISEATTIFGDLGLDFKINQHFRISGHYRFIQDRRNDDSYALSNRFYANIRYRQRLKPFILVVREQVQSEYKPFNSDEKINPALYSRTKAQLKLDLNKKITPYLYAEVFNPLNNFPIAFIDKVRISTGFEYQWNPRNMIDAGYMIQRSFDITPKMDYVICLGYFLSL
jgi:hypothetical protein